MNTRLKPKSKAMSRRLPPVKIYLDDVQAIVDALAAVPVPDGSGTGRVQIEVGDYELNDLGDVSKLPFTQSRKLVITRLNPYISVDFGVVRFAVTRCWLYAATDDISSLGALEKVRAILASRRRPVVHVLTNFYASGSQLVFTLALVAASFVFPGSWPLAVKAGLLLLASLNLINMVVVWFWLFQGANILFLKHRKDMPSFFERNRDTIIMVVISSVLTGIVTFVAGYFVAVATTKH